MALVNAELGKESVPTNDIEIASPNDSNSGSTENGSTPADAGWKSVFVREIRSHKFGYGVLAVALVAGPILITMIFPEVTPIQAVVGGLAFGVYSALCAVPQKFM